MAFSRSGQALRKFFHALSLWAKHQDLTQSRKQTFIENLSADVPINGTYDLFTFIVPSKSKFRLVSFGNYTDSYSAWGTIFWSFYLNDTLIYPYEKILDQIGTGAHRQPIQPVEVFGGSTFRIQASNPTSAIVAMGVSLRWELYFQ